MDFHSESNCLLNTDLQLLGIEHGLDFHKIYPTPFLLHCVWTFEGKRWVEDLFLLFGFLLGRGKNNEVVINKLLLLGVGATFMCAPKSDEAEGKETCTCSL